MKRFADLQTRMDPKIAVSVVFVAAMFMSIMDTSIVNVALPAIGRDFRVAPTAVDGISIAFLVSLALFMPASGWLGDRFGGKRVLMAAIVVFTVASALCGVATSVGELVAFRVLQGIGGGMLAPVGTAMLFRTFPPQERVRAASIIILPTALAPALAPVIGGLLVTDASWRWVFYVNVPIGVAAFIFGLLFVKHSVESRPGRFDRPGFLLSGIGLGLFMYGISEGPDLGWGSARVLTTVGVGAALLATMVIVELRTPEPIVALRLLANRLFRSATGAVVMVSIAFLGTLFAITLYFQDGRGLSALNAGLSQFPSAIGVMVGSQIASRVVYWRLGPRRHLTLGLCGVAVFIAMLALMGGDTSLWWARLILFGMGFSLAQVFVPAQAASFATISAADTGRASTLYNASRQLGGAIGVALLTTAIVIVGPVHVVAGHVVANLTAYRITFLIASAAALLGVFASITIRDADAEQTMVNPRDRKLGPPEAAADALGTAATPPVASQPPDENPSRRSRPVNGSGSARRVGGKPWKAARSAPKTAWRRLSSSISGALTSSPDSMPPSAAVTTSCAGMPGSTERSIPGPRGTQGHDSGADDMRAQPVLSLVEVTNASVGLGGRWLDPPPCLSADDARRGATDRDHANGGTVQGEQRRVTG